MPDFARGCHISAGIPKGNETVDKWSREPGDRHKRFKRVGSHPRLLCLTSCYIVVAHCISLWALSPLTNDTTAGVVSVCDNDDASTTQPARHSLVSSVQTRKLWKPYPLPPQRPINKTQLMLIMNSRARVSIVWFIANVTLVRRQFYDISEILTVQSKWDTWIRIILERPRTTRNATTLARDMFILNVAFYYAIYNGTIFSN